MAESSGDSDPEDINYDELNSSESEASGLIEHDEQKTTLADLVSHTNIQEQIQGKLDEKTKLENLPVEIKKLPENSVIKKALIDLLVYDSDTLYGVYTPGGISIDELTLACAFCRTLQTVKNIILSGNNIGPDAADPVCWCLTNKSVLAVDLSNNPITDTLVRQIGKIIRMQNEVLILNRHCEVAHENIFHREKDLQIAEANLKTGEEKLLAAIEKLEKAEGALFGKAKKVEAQTLVLDQADEHKKQLKVLVAEAKVAIEKAKKYLIDMEQRLQSKINILKTGPGMRVLRPQSSERRLQNMVGSGCYIERLILSGCLITDIGAVELASALKGHRSLKSLTLSDNKITDVAAIAIADSLKVNEMLQTLDLGFNLITDDGACALAEWVEKSESVQRIMLNFNNLSVRTAKTFIKALEIQILKVDEGKMRMLNLLGIKELPPDVRTNFKQITNEYVDTFNLKPFLLKI
jgi:hypothetical protein